MIADPARSFRVGQAFLPAPPDEHKLVEVGTDHRLATPEPLVAMLGACEGRGGD